MHLIRAGWLIHRRLRLGLLMLGVGLYLLLLPASTWAHPLGNFTVNRYSRLEVGATEIAIFYVLDMAEIATFQELAWIDTNHDGHIQASEHNRYVAQRLQDLSEQLSLMVDGSPITLEAHGSSLEFPPGQGGLRTLRLTVHLVAGLPQSVAPRRVVYQDQTYSGRLGWQEVVVQAERDAQVFDATVPAQDRSQELRVYPQDLLQSPLAVSSAHFSFQPSGPAQTQVPAGALPLPSGASAAATDHFAALIQTPIRGPFGLVLALLVAFALGSAHALTPGHGKTVVAAYLVGSRGTVRHALFLGLTTTITHTAGVFGLGIITLFVSEFILPEQLYPWLGVASGLIVCVLGMTLLRVRMRGLHWHRVGMYDHDHSHDHHHDHPHDHHHDHPHEHGAEHTHGHQTHSHMPPGADGSAITWRSLLALGVSGGLLPCPSALIVLLSAIALGRIGLGLLLIIAFSLGLASVLTVVGVLLVHARRLFDRVPVHIGLVQTLPVVSAGIVVLLGAGITLQSLIQTGWI